MREAIAQKYQQEYGLSYRKEDVIVSCGAKHSLYNMLQAVVNPGDEVLIPAPYWVSYSDMALLAGGAPKLIPTDESSAFRIKPEQLQAALTPKTRVFFLNSPCNPTGASYDRGRTARHRRDSGKTRLSDFRRRYLREDRLRRL